LFGYSYIDDTLLHCLAIAILARAAKTKSQQYMQAAHRVAAVQSSAAKITTAAIYYYCTTSLYYAHLFVRESWLWHVLLPRLDSYFFGNALQNGKQLFFSRLPQMTKYFVMRECENI
jgi:hypothetical protein